MMDKDENMIPLEEEALEQVSGGLSALREAGSQLNQIEALGSLEAAASVKISKFRLPK